MVHKATSCNFLFLIDMKSKGLETAIEMFVFAMVLIKQHKIQE